MAELQTTERSNDAGQVEFAFDLRLYIDVILRRRWAIAAFFGATVALVTFFSMRQTKIYQATATLIIETQAPQVLGNQIHDVAETGTSSVWASKEFYETQFNIIRSRSLAQKVVDRLGLINDDAFLGLDKIQDLAIREKVRESADPAAMVQGGVKVELVRDSRVATIKFDDRDPQRAQRIANAVMEVYVQQNSDRKNEISRSASEKLANQVAGLKSQLETSELKLYTYKKDHDLVDSSFENKQNLTQQRVGSIFEALNKVQQHKAELDAKVKAIELAKKSGDPAALQALPEVARNPEITHLRARIAESQADLAALEARYGPEFPRLVEAKSRLSQLQGAFLKEVQYAIQTSLNDYKVVTATEENLVRLLVQAKADALEVNHKEMDYKRLAREDADNQRLYELVLKSIKDIDLSSPLRANNVYGLDPALVPHVPIRPRVSTNVLVGAVLGLLGGLALAFLLEYQDSTISSQEEVERRLGLSVLGLLPTIKAGPEAESPDRDLFVLRSPKSSVAECCRIIRTNLNFLSTERPLRRILITSSGPQEGKTTSLVNIGVTMALSGKRVLMIDTDLRRPRLHRSFRQTNERGLTTLIAEGGKADREARTTEVPGLFILPSGPVPPNPAELLHTARFREILDELQGQFDLLLLDSPPVGAVSDALVLAGIVDGTMMVLKAFQTDRGLASQTLRALRDVRAKMLGAVLNNIDLEKRGYGYYQGYYYGYGKYYGESTPSSTPAP